MHGGEWWKKEKRKREEGKARKMDETNKMDSELYSVFVSFSRQFIVILSPWQGVEVVFIFQLWLKKPSPAELPYPLQPIWPVSERWHLNELRLLKQHKVFFGKWKNCTDLFCCFDLETIELASATIWPFWGILPYFELPKSCKET